MRVGNVCLVYFVWVALSGRALALPSPPEIILSLAETETKAIVLSKRMKAARAESSALSEKALGVMSRNYPRISLDGTYRYQTVVPSVTLPFGTHPTVRLGGNNNYSIGPTLNWTVWDFGSVRSASHSVLELAQAKEDETKAAERDILLSARQAYFRVQWALEQLRLVGDSYKLSDLQYRDISRRVRAGASSKTDLLMAHRGVNQFGQQFRQGQSDLASALQELFSLTEIPPKINTTVPIIREALDDAALSAQASVLVQVDSIEKSLSELKSRGGALSPPGSDHPLVRRQYHLAQSFHLASQSASANHWPKLQLQLRSSYDFPNASVPEWFNQNAVGVTLSMPLWDWGTVSHEVQEDESQMEAARARQEQVNEDLLRDWNKAYSQWLGYKTQSEQDSQIVAEAEELTHLVYESYKGGRNTYLEVESANLRMLETKVQSARDRIQVLNQLAILMSLTEESHRKGGGP